MAARYDLRSASMPLPARPVLAALAPDSQHPHSLAAAPASDASVASSATAAVAVAAAVAAAAAASAAAAAASASDGPGACRPIAASSRFIGGPADAARARHCALASRASRAARTSAAPVTSSTATSTQISSSAFSSKDPASNPSSCSVSSAHVAITADLRPTAGPVRRSHRFIHRGRFSPLNSSPPKRSLRNTRKQNGLYGAGDHHHRSRHLNNHNQTAIQDNQYHNHQPNDPKCASGSAHASKDGSRTLTPSPIDVAAPTTPGTASARPTSACTPTAANAATPPPNPSHSHAQSPLQPHTSSSLPPIEPSPKAITPKPKRSTRNNKKSQDASSSAGFDDFLSSNILEQFRNMSTRTPAAADRVNFLRGAGCDSSRRPGLTPSLSAPCASAFADAIAQSQTSNAIHPAPQNTQGEHPSASSSIRPSESKSPSASTLCRAVSFQSITSLRPESRAGRLSRASPNVEQIDPILGHRTRRDADSESDDDDEDVSKDNVNDDDDGDDGDDGDDDNDNVNFDNQNGAADAITNATSDHVNNDDAGDASGRATATTTATVATAASGVSNRRRASVSPRSPMLKRQRVVSLTSPQPEASAAPAASTQHGRIQSTNTVLAAGLSETTSGPHHSQLTARLLASVSPSSRPVAFNHMPIDDPGSMFSPASETAAVSTDTQQPGQPVSHDSRDAASLFSLPGPSKPSSSLSCSSQLPPKSSRERDTTDDVTSGYSLPEGPNAMLKRSYHDVNTRTPSHVRSSYSRFVTDINHFDVWVDPELEHEDSNPNQNNHVNSIDRYQNDVDADGGGVEVQDIMVVDDYDAGPESNKENEPPRNDNAPQTINPVQVPTAVMMPPMVQLDSHDGSGALAMGHRGLPGIAAAARLQAHERRPSEPMPIPLRSSNPAMSSLSAHSAPSRQREIFGDLGIEGRAEYRDLMDGRFELEDSSPTRSISRNVTGHSHGSRGGNTIGDSASHGLGSGSSRTSAMGVSSSSVVASQARSRTTGASATTVSAANLHHHIQQQQYPSSRASQYNDEPMSPTARRGSGSRGDAASSRRVLPPLTNDTRFTPGPASASAPYGSSVAAYTTRQSDASSLASTTRGAVGTHGMSLGDNSRGSRYSRPPNIPAYTPTMGFDAAVSSPTPSTRTVPRAIQNQQAQPAPHQPQFHQSRSLQQTLFHQQLGGDAMSSFGDAAPRPTSLGASPASAVPPMRTTHRQADYPPQLGASRHRHHPNPNASALFNNTSFLIANDLETGAERATTSENAPLVVPVAVPAGVVVSTHAAMHRFEHDTDHAMSTSQIGMNVMMDRSSPVAIEAATASSISIAQTHHTHGDNNDVGGADQMVYPARDCDSMQSGLMAMQPRALLPQVTPGMTVPRVRHLPMTYDSPAPKLDYNRYGPSSPTTRGLDEVSHGAAALSVQNDTPGDVICDLNPPQSSSSSSMMSSSSSSSSSSPPSLAQAAGPKRQRRSERHSKQTNGQASSRAPTLPPPPPPSTSSSTPLVSRKSHRHHPSRDIDAVPTLEDSTFTKPQSSPHQQQQKTDTSLSKHASESSGTDEDSVTLSNTGIVKSTHGVRQQRALRSQRHVSTISS